MPASSPASASVESGLGEKVAGGCRAWSLSKYRTCSQRMVVLPRELRGSFSSSALGMMVMRNSTWLLLCAVFVVAGGCGTKVIGLRTDPSFTYDSLSAGGIVVGGVTFRRDEVETAASRGFSASLLRASILEKRPDIDVQPAMTITQAVGPESYTALLDDYELAGELEQARLAQLSEALADLRYVIFARIEADVIDRDTTVQGDTTTYRITRTVTTGFQVYDLTARIPVWSGTITESKKEENEDVQDGNFFGDLLVALLFNKYPSTPEFNKLLRKTFEGFAKQLPKR